MRIELRQNIYHGSPTWESSVIGRDLIKDFALTSPSSISTTTAWKFEFYTKDEILVSINGSDPIFFDMNDEVELRDNVWSFKLLSNGATFRYFACL